MSIETKRDKNQSPKSIIGKLSVAISLNSSYKYTGKYMRIALVIVFSHQFLVSCDSTLDSF